jgi:hypothetical protein
MSYLPSFLRSAALAAATLLLAVTSPIGGMFTATAIAVTTATTATFVAASVAEARPASAIIATVAGTYPIAIIAPATSP